MKMAMLTLAGVLIAAAPALAHHPFASEFDANAPVTLTGTIMNVTWANPHVVIHVNVKDSNGQTRDWGMEAASTETMTMKGWNQSMLKPGEQITVKGYRAKTEPFMMAARMITLADGKQMSTASNDGGPQT
jgi:hypothetical protein